MNGITFIVFVAVWTLLVVVIANPTAKENVGKWLRKLFKME